MRTCVGYAENLSAICDSSSVVCAGDETYGTMEQIGVALLESTSRPDGVHPECPTGNSHLADKRFHRLVILLPGIPSVFKIWRISSPTNENLQYSFQLLSQN